ncbi:uncharacterized protein N7483_001925 [Penicillium malachiteum]|uniref:uncharacterized protein n=1 Tax=Penicillium malachiteum TaxID=1324776 RepID=UPI0025474F1F|nr:uncharacterized protein N7483_001925 [Penicillium malachiteum]KAJ5736800.1 hypothetical protein N7483_001925 [Penicillium malachiteum]
MDRSQEKTNFHFLSAVLFTPDHREQTAQAAMTVAGLLELQDNQPCSDNTSTSSLIAVAGFTETSGQSAQLVSENYLLVSLATLVVSDRTI